jgi:hypothetical protein
MLRILISASNLPLVGVELAPPNNNYVQIWLVQFHHSTMVNARKKTRKVEKKAARASSSAQKVAPKSLDTNLSTQPADKDEREGKIIQTNFAIDGQSTSKKSNLKDDKEISETDQKPKRKVRFAKNAAGTFLAEASRASDDNMPANDSELWGTTEGGKGCEIDLEDDDSDEDLDVVEDEGKSSGIGTEESSESDEDGQFYMFLERVKD